MQHKITHFDRMMSKVDGVQTSLAPTNSTEAMDLAGLNFEVARSGLYLDGEIPVSNRFQAIRRMDTNEVLGVVGPQYTPIQNSDAFGILDHMDGIKFGRAGFFGFGETCFIQVDLGQENEVLKNDPVVSHALVRTNHSGKKVVSFVLTPIRVICQNSLRAALNKKNNFGHIKISHNSQSNEQIQEAKELITWSKQSFGNYVEIFKNFASREITQAEAKMYVESVVRPNKRKAYLEAEFNIDPTNPYSLNNPYQDKDDPKAVQAILDLAASSKFRAKEGTLWGIYNAATEYFDHAKSFRPGSSAQAESHFGESAMKSAAFDSAVAMLKRMAID